MVIFWPRKPIPKLNNSVMTSLEFIYIYFKWFLFFLGWHSSRCPTVSCHTPTDPQSGRWTRQDVSTSHTHTHMRVESIKQLSVWSESLSLCTGVSFQAWVLWPVPDGPWGLWGGQTHTHHTMAPSCTLLSIAPVFTHLTPLTHTHSAILQVRRLLIPERLHVTDVPF